MNWPTFILLACIVVTILTFLLPRAQPGGRTHRKLLISLGSGGHTTELLLALKTIDITAFPRVYYVTSGDTLSSRHAMDFEAAFHVDSAREIISSDDNNKAKAVIRTIPRARKVGQAWSSTVFTAARSLVSAVMYIYHDQPDILICNGPGTCVMLAVAAYFFRVIGVKHCRIIFIESFARVKRLSMSGKILIHIVDRFLVMWPELAKQYDRAEYAGLVI